ncbi:MAG: EamA family transporter, partial [Acidimicrobiia bacterium]
MLAATCWGIADYFVAVYARRIGWFKTLVWMSSSAAAAFTLLFLAMRPKVQIQGGDWLWLAGWALLVLPNYAAFYRALELGPIAIVTPVVAAYAAVVVILSLVFLSEDLNLKQGIGIVLAIAGVMLASADLRRLEPGKRRIGPGVWFGLASMVGFGIGSFAGGVFSREYGWFLPAFIVRIFITTMVLALATRNQS